MELNACTLEGWKVVRLREKRLDSFVEEAFKTAMIDVLNDGTKKLILDLSTVEFIDSAGLGVIVFCRRLLGDDGQVVLASLRPGVATTLRLTRLDRVFPLVEHAESVIEASFEV